MSQVKKCTFGDWIFFEKKNSKKFDHFTSIFDVKKNWVAIYQVYKIHIKNRFIVHFFYTMSALCRVFLDFVRQNWYFVLLFGTEY